MADSDVVLYEKLGAVGHLVLNRPKVINAFNIQMRDELYMSLSAANDDPEVRAILISGAGDRGFCAGADLSEFGTAPSQVVASRHSMLRLANVGVCESMNMLLANSPMNAQRALSVGLAHRLVSKKFVLDEGFAMAEVLAALDPRSIASAKQTIQTGLDMPIDQGIGLERRETAKLISWR